MFLEGCLLSALVWVFDCNIVVLLFRFGCDYFAGGGFGFGFAFEGGLGGEVGWWLLGLGCFFSGGWCGIDSYLHRLCWMPACVGCLTGIVVLCMCCGWFTAGGFVLENALVVDVCGWVCL